jgi:hypothetical protein
LAEDQRGELETVREKNNRLALEVNGAKKPDFFEKARKFEIQLVLVVLVLLCIDLLI